MSKRVNKIIVSIPWKSHINDLLWDLVDLAVIGNPFCPTSPDGIGQGKAFLNHSLEILSPHLEKCIFTLPVAPLDNEIPLMETLLEGLSTAGVGGVEVQSHAMAWHVSSDYPDLPIYFGSFSNVHTADCAKIMEEYGALGGCLPFEVDFREYLDVMKQINLDIHLPVFGRFPVAFTRGCHFHNKNDEKCKCLCKENRLVDFGQEKSVIHRGRALFSTRYLNLTDFFSDLKKMGFASYRVEGLLDDYKDINQAIKAVKGLLEAPDSTYEETFRNEINKLAGGDFCNGFFFGARGMEFVGPEKGGKLLEQA